MYNADLSRLFTCEAGYLGHEGREGGLVAEGGERRHAGVRRPDGEPEQHVRDGHLVQGLSVIYVIITIFCRLLSRYLLCPPSRS